MAGVVFVLIRNGIAQFKQLPETEVAFFDQCKQSPAVLVQASNGSGWRVNLNLVNNPEAYRLTFPTFYQEAFYPTELIDRCVMWDTACDRIEVVHVL